MDGNALQYLSTRNAKLAYSGPLESLGESARTVTMTHDLEELIHELTARFPAGDLITTGVLEVDEEGELCFVEALRSPDTLLVPLSDHDRLVYDIVTPSGLLTGNTPTIVGTLNDAGAQRNLKRSTNRLFLVGTSMDLAMLTDLLLPAALVSDLYENRELLRQLLEQLVWSTPETGRPVKREALDGGNVEFTPNVDLKDVTLVFANWSPGTLSINAPPQLLELITEMNRARRLLDADVTRVGIWTPSAEVLENVRYCLDWKSVAHAIRILLDSADDATHRLDHFLAPRSTPQIDFVSARWNLEDVIRKVNAGELPPDALREAARRYEKMVDETFFEPALVRAVSNSRSLDRGSRVVMAELERTILRMAPRTQESIANERAGTESTTQFLKLTAEYMRALKVLRS